MRGITVPVRFEHGDHCCNAAGWRLTARRRLAILCLKTSQKDSSAPGAQMANSFSVLAGTLISVFSLTSIAVSQPACVTQNMAVPPGANTTDKAGPFFIDTTGLDFKTAPPTRDPSNPNYPRATELPDGTLPPPGAEGNFIIGPTHNPAPETIAKEGVPRGTTKSFILSSKESTIYNPGLIRD